MENQKREKIERLLTALIDQINEIISSSIELKRYNDQIFIGSIFFNILDITDSISILVKEGKDNSIPILFRTIIENYADLINLCNDNAYYFLLKEIDLVKKHKTFQKWNEPNDNPFFPDKDCISEDYRKMIREEKKELKELRIKNLESFGKDRLDIKFKFKLSNTFKLYESIYQYNNSDVHNSLSVLSERFIHINKNEVSLTFKKSFKESIKVPHLQTLSGIVIESGKLIMNRFGKSLNQKTESELMYLHNSLKEILNNISPE